MTAIQGVSTTDPRRTLLESPMSVFQWAAIFITFALSALDGFDVLAITLVAPSLVNAWHVNPAALGLVFSVGVIGMGVGSFLVAPLGDRLGRRTMILVTLSLMSGAMLLSATASNVGWLAAWRLVTGIGIGATVAIINPLAAEYANTKRRDLAIGMMAIGFPLGGVFGGAVAAMLLAHEGWRAVFVFGGTTGLVMIAVVFLVLPEPIAFMIERQGSGALQRINRFLRRCGHPAIATMPPRAEATSRARPLDIFRAGNHRATLHLASVTILLTITVYFFLNWLPQMVAHEGFAPALAAKVSVVNSMAGALGGGLLGWGVRAFGLKPLLLIALIGMALATTAFGLIPPQLGALMLGAAFAGFFVNAGMVGIHSLIARTFPTHTRATGAGFVLGVGRVGSAIGPAAAGFLFASHMDRAAVCATLALGAIAAAILLSVFRVRELGSVDFKVDEGLSLAAV